MDVTFFEKAAPTDLTFLLPVRPSVRPSPVRVRSLPRFCQSDICRPWSVQVISAVSSALSLSLPPAQQFLAYPAKTNIIPPQNEEGRIALSLQRMNPVCVRQTGVSLRGLARSAVSTSGSSRLSTAEWYGLWHGGRPVGLMCDRSSGGKKAYRLPNVIILMTAKRVVLAQGSDSQGKIWLENWFEITF